MGPGGQEAINLPALPPITEWEDRQRLAYEKEALGFYVSGHPIDRYEAVIEKFANTTTESIQELKALELSQITEIYQQQVGAMVGEISVVGDFDSVARAPLMTAARGTASTCFARDVYLDGGAHR